MLNTEEQLQDVIQICSYLLKEVLHDCPQVNSTPEGRMVAQLKWLVQQAKGHSLQLPVNPSLLATLRRVHLEGELNHCASSPDKAYLEIEIHLARLLAITLDANLIYKQAYSQHLTEMIHTLEESSEVKLYSNYEGLKKEMHSIVEAINLRQQILPLKSMLPKFPIFRDLYTKAIVQQQVQMQRVAALVGILRKLLFSGVRPASWLSPADATTHLLQIKRELGT